MSTFNPTLGKSDAGKSRNNAPSSKTPSNLERKRNLFGDMMKINDNLLKAISLKKDWKSEWQPIWIKTRKRSDDNKYSAIVMN